MTRLIGIDVYSFSMEDGFNYTNRDYVVDSNTKIKHFLYKSGIYINLHTIKLAYDTGKVYHTLENGVEKNQIQLSKIIFSDGFSFYSSIDGLEMIVKLGNSDLE